VDLNTSTGRIKPNVVAQTNRVADASLFPDA